MAKLPAAFNSNEHSEMADFSALPSGEYIFQVKESSMEKCSSTAKDPNGQYLKLTLECLSPKFKGRQVWVNLNLINKNPKAVEIANSELTSICKAVGKPVIQDSQELHGIPMIVKLGVVKDNRGDDYPPKNDVKAYKPVSAGSSAETSGDTETDGEKKKPWEK